MKKSKPSEYAKQADGSTPSRAKGSRKIDTRAGRASSSSSRSSAARRTRISADWKDFALRLATHLPVLAADQFLIVSVPAASRYVQFTPNGSWGMRAEAVSNGCVEADAAHSQSDDDVMRALGWQTPTLPPFDRTDLSTIGIDAADDDMETVDDGSPHWSVDTPSPVDYHEMAMLAVRTLITVYGVRKPAMLQYYAFDDSGSTILLPGLGIPAETPPQALDLIDMRPLEEVVEDACAAAADADVRREGAMHLLEVDGIPFRVTAEADDGLVRVVCRIMPVDDVGGDLFELMNRMNANYLPFGYLFVRDGDVRWATEMVHEPIVPGALVASMRRGAEVVRMVLAMVKRT
jgi:hypothetical protein